MVPSSKDLPPPPGFSDVHVSLARNAIGVVLYPLPLPSLGPLIPSSAMLGSSDSDYVQGRYYHYYIHYSLQHFGVHQLHSLLSLCFSPCLSLLPISSFPFTSSFPSSLPEVLPVSGPPS